MLEALVPPVVDAAYDKKDGIFCHFAACAAPDKLQLIQIGTQMTIPGYDYGPATREHELVHFVISGKGYVNVCGTQFQVNAGEIFYIPKGCTSYYEGDKTNTWTYIWVGFEGSWAERLLEDINLNRKALIANIADMSVMKEIEEELDRFSSEENAYLKLMPVFWKLINELARVKGREPKSITRSLKYGKAIDGSPVTDVIRRLETGYMRDISVDDLAKEFGFTRGYLSRVFKMQTGFTIIEYLTNLRIEKAKILLLQNKISPIGKVAASCGYADPLFFSRVFKKKTGFSPREWRKQSGNDNN